MWFPYDLTHGERRRADMSGSFGSGRVPGMQAGREGVRTTESKTSGHPPG